MPKALVCVEPEKVGWQEYTEPDLASGRVRLRAEFAAAKHGTEMALYKAYWSRRGTFDQERRIFLADSPRGSWPIGLGNMVVGTVTECGPDVKELSTGDRVLAYAPFRETHVVREDRTWKMPPDLAWQSAVCLDPADFALGAVRDGHVRVGDAVAVFGMGAIGLMVVQIAKLSGAGPIIAVDPLANRREAAQAVGADEVLDPLSCDAGLEIKDRTGGRGADVIVDYSGNRQALQAALRGVAFGGTVVAGAFPPPYDAGLDLGAEAHLNRPQVIFSRANSDPNRDHPRWDNKRIYDLCWQLIREGKLHGEEIVSPVVPFEELLAEYPKIATDPGSNIKLGVKYS